METFSKKNFEFGEARIVQGDKRVGVGGPGDKGCQ